jgi:dipeptidyl aminopeptidase/acylaminoacyl peptidase
MNHRLRVFAVLGCAVLAVSLAAAPLGWPQQRQAPEKRKMEFMDVMHIRTAGAGSLSPDGRWVLYTLSELNWKEGRRFTDIWIAPTDSAGAGPRQMTFTREKSESSPEWARDSRQFAFLSDREGRTQLYLMRTDGGEARRLTDAREGVNAFAFSRDGKWLAFSAGRADQRQLWLIDLETEAEPVQLTKRPTPVRSWQWSRDSAAIFFTAPDSVDRDDQRRRQQRFDVRIADPEEPPAHLWSVAIADKQEKRWTEGDGYGVGSFTLSDDGRWAAFRSASRNRYAAGAAENESEVYLLDLASGASRRLTENQVGEGPPSFSPDGRWLVFSAPNDFTWGRDSKFYLVPTAGGEMRKLLGEQDISVGFATWSADSRALYFSNGVGVDSHLFSVTVPDGRLTQLTRERGTLSGGFDRDAGMFLLTRSTPEEPANYYVARPDDIGRPAKWVRVTDNNPQVAAFALGAYETVRWRAGDGVEVEGILIKPVGYEPGKRYPLIVQIHGGPASAYMNNFSGGYGTYVHVFAGAGYAVFQPNYRGSSNYGEKFRMEIAGDYFRQGYDDIITGVDSLIARGIADPDALGMMGWSAGGHWSNWTLVNTDRFKAISSGAGAVNWISMYAQTDVQAPREFYFRGKPWENWDHYVEVSPLRYITRAKTPTLIHVGEADPRVPKPQSDELHMALKKLGVPTEYIVYPRMPHGITEPRYQLVKMVSEFNWFEKWIRGKEGWFDWKDLLATLPEEPGARPGARPAAEPGEPSGSAEAP